MRTAVVTAALVAGLAGLAGLAGCGSSGHEEVVAPAGTPTSSSSPTPSAAAVDFLAASDLPQGDRYGTWQRGDQQAGLGDPPYFCLAEALPADRTSLRLYSSGMDAEARQFLVRGADAALETEVRSAVADCAARYRSKFPQDKATGQDYPATASGPAINGVFFAPKDSEYSMQLYAVKRSGDTLSVLVLGQGGQAAEAPVDAFRASAAKL
jgi:hypothetical protein